MALSSNEISKIEKQFQQLALEEKKKDAKNQTLIDIISIPVSDAVVSKLLSHQVQHVQNEIYALQKHGVAIDGSDTGTGKTYSTVAICKQLGLTPLVICPKPVVSTWFKVCAEFDVTPLAIVNYETFKNGKYYRSLTEFRNEIRHMCPYIKWHYENVTDFITGDTISQLSKIEWIIPNNTLIIFDEAHKGKNGLSNKIPTMNSQLLVSVKPYINKEVKKYCLFLSATITDKLTNFDVYGYVMDLYRPYMKKIFKRFLGKLGTEPLIRVHKLLFPHRGARMNIKTIKKDTGDVLFRGNDVKAETYKISKDKADEIEALHKEIQQAMQDLRGKEKAARHPLEVILRARQQIELLKVPVFVYLIKFYLDAGNSVVIFVNFNKTMKEITDHLLGDSDNTNEIITIDKIDFVRGGQSADERETIIDDFSKDKLRLLLCNIKAGGVGVSFHDIRGVYPRVSLISPTWAAIDLKQSLGRIYRANAKSDAKQRVIYCTAQSDTDNRNEKSFSIEEMICQNVNEKLQNISYINDGNLSGHVDMLDKKDMEEKLKNTSD